MPPASSPRSWSRNSARAVRKMIGMSFVRSSSISFWATCQPSSRGIITSRRMTSGSSDRASSRPASPSDASITSIPSASRLTRQSRRIGASSSITRALVIADISLYPLALEHSPSGHCRRQFEDEAGALAFSGVDPDPAPHGGNEALRHEQPQPDAAACVASGLELPEDALSVGCRNADALVGDPDLDGAFSLTSRDRDRTPFGGVANRVVEQIRQDLPQFLGIGLRPQRLA